MVRRWFEFVSKGNFVITLAACTILQLLELIPQVATQTVPKRAAIEIWHNQGVINLSGSFFWNKGSHTFEGTYELILAYFFNMFAPSKLNIYGNAQGFGMFNLLDDLIFSSYYNVFILDNK